MAPPEYSIFCMGNALLDMRVTDGEELLKKYELKANDAILAGEKHSTIYDDLEKDPKVTYFAGGIQNASRGAAYLLPPDSVVYTGCVGDDELAKKLNDANKLEGLHQVCLVKKGEKTGVCAAIITGHDRSLVTSLRAAVKFDISHLSSPTVAPLIETAKLFYIESYFLIHGVESVVFLAQKAFDAKKVFVLNLSAPYIPRVYKDEVQRVLPYCDIVIANDSEAKAWASATGLADEENLLAIAKAMAAFEKKNDSRSRLVIFTQGAEPTLVATLSGDKWFPVIPLKSEEIVDTNGAGDAFAGGFLAALVSGKSPDECVEVGQKLSKMCIGQIGPQYKWPKVKIL